MSQKEPTEPYVYQPDPAKSVEDKSWALSGPGTRGYEGRRFTKAEAEYELKKLFTRHAANLLDMASRCDRCGGKLVMVAGDWWCVRGCTKSAADAYEKGEEP